MTATEVKHDAWVPNAGPQTLLIECPVREVFYGGARGGGKSDGLIGDWVGHAGEYGANARGLLVRRTLPELDDLIERSKQVLGLLGWDYNASKHEWRGPDGALLRMRYLDRDQDARNYQGHSYTWIGVDEVGNFPSPKPIDLLSATLRSAAGVPCVLRLTGNPGGPGHGWVRQRYIDPHPKGLTPFMREAHGQQFQCVFIPSTLENNPYLGPEYEAQIAAATAGDDALFRAWRYGAWDAFVGQMYRLERGVQISPNRPRAAYGDSFRWIGAMDWGYVQGAFGLFAVDTEGRLEQVLEFYDGFSELHARKAAHAIVDELERGGWPIPTEIYADEQMWQEHGAGASTLAEEFIAAMRDRLRTDAPTVMKAEHRPGSRTTKVALLHQWLAPMSEQRGPDGRVPPWALPALRISERCANTIRVMQEIPRASEEKNPNDVDKAYREDHPHDMLGFAVSSRAHPAAAKAKVTPEHIHPGLRADGTRKSRVWTEEDEIMDRMKAMNVGTSGRYGRRVGR